MGLLTEGIHQMPGPKKNLVSRSYKTPPETHVGIRRVAAHDRRNIQQALEVIVEEALKKRRINLDDVEELQKTG